MRLWVVDTSPLIFLAKLDRLDLLRRSADRIVAPEAVFREAQRREDEASAMIEAIHISWLEVRRVGDRRVLEVLAADLDAGESEAVALALELKAERLVMDDLDARRLARRVGLPLVGTLGLLLAAKLRGEISSLIGEIDRLLDAGFRVSEDLKEAVLRTAGEL